MSHRQWLGLLIIMPLFFTACSRPFGRAADDSSKEKPETVEASTDQLVHLTPEQIRLAGLQVSAVQERDVPVTIKVAGRVAPRAQAQLAVTSPFAGRVVSLAPVVRIGSNVGQGETLAVIEQLLTATESADFLVNRVQLQATIDQTQKEAAHHQKEYQRAQQLYEVGAISLKDLQQAELDFNLAQSRHEAAVKAVAEYDAILAQSQNTPRRTVLTAPIAGTIVVADITPGQYIEPTQALLTIADLSSVWIEASVFEVDLATIQQAREANLTARAYPGEVLPANLVTMGDVVNPDTRTVKAIFAVQNFQRKLKLGMSVEVSIPTQRLTRSLVIPVSAIVEGEHPLVYVQKGSGRFGPHPITITDRQGDVVLITQGLDVGDMVVTAGVQQLHNEAMKARISLREEGR
jgi:cobalt-zinc-cadmium efflux system membrane fusion protein